ncbi:MAG: DMT family transporter [Anaerolineae bacterium]|nr:DMT family transporter [Anaerolineae bacterium]
MPKRLAPHTAAVLQALFVTFLWSTSWVLIKIGLGNIPALTFAGLRYSLATLCLLPLALRPAQRESLRRLSRRNWISLIVLGLLYITVTAGAQFLGLAYLPAITTNLLLSVTTVLVTLLGMFLLAEQPALTQWGGVGLYLIGVAVYFYPVALPDQQTFGFVIVLIGVLANAVSSVLGRGINRGGEIGPLIVTVVSMGVGGIVLLIVGIVIQGLPSLSLVHWAIIGWLAVVNTALAFTLWNHTLRTLSALESSIINNMMMVQIPVLAVLFLGEHLTLQQVIGMALAGIGILVVQLRRASTFARRTGALRR